MGLGNPYDKQARMKLQVYKMYNNVPLEDPDNDEQASTSIQTESEDTSEVLVRGRRFVIFEVIEGACLAGVTRRHIKAQKEAALKNAYGYLQGGVNGLLVRRNFAANDSAVRCIQGVLQGSEARRKIKHQFKEMEMRRTEFTKGISRVQMSDATELWALYSSRRGRDVILHGAENGMPLEIDPVSTASGIRIKTDHLPVSVYHSAELASSSEVNYGHVLKKDGMKSIPAMQKIRILAELSQSVEAQSNSLDEITCQWDETEWHMVAEEINAANTMLRSHKSARVRHNANEHQALDLSDVEQSLWDERDCHTGTDEVKTNDTMSLHHASKNKELDLDDIKQAPWWNKTDWRSLGHKMRLEELDATSPQCHDSQYIGKISTLQDHGVNESMSSHNVINEAAIMKQTLSRSLSRPNKFRLREWQFKFSTLEKVIAERQALQCHDSVSIDPPKQLPNHKPKSDFLTRWANRPSRG